MKEQLLKQHTMVTHATSFSEVCEPIFRSTPINYIGLAKIYANGSRSYLISNPAWGEVLLKNDYHLAGTEDALLDKPDNSHYPWFLSNLFNLNQQTENLFKDCVANNYGNGITLVEQGTDFVEFVHICANGGYEKVNDYLTNHIDLLWNNVLYIRESIGRSKELKTGYNTRYQYDLTVDFNHNKPLNLTPNKYYLGGAFEGIYFSAREMDCLVLLCQNKTIKQQAHLLRLSPRTIEAYYQTIKGKTKCRSQAELILKLAQNNAFKSILRQKTYAFSEIYP